MKSKVARFVFIILGLAVLAAGLFLVKTAQDPQGIMQVLPYIMVGVGCGLFGHGMGELLAAKAIHSDPAFEKRMEVEKHDERNVAMANKAKSRAFDMMTHIFGALILSFGLMGVELAPLLLLVFAYLLVEGLSVYYRVRYEKEM